MLEALDAPLLAANGCFFGGGTAIALKYGEYRESNDVDFLVSDVDGYRALRQRMSSRDGIDSITRKDATLMQTRDVRADQYGIRTLVHAVDVDIKFEIVLEARIALEAPTSSDRICGVSTLTAVDMATSKLLANCDRWADDSVNSRDLIDLAMMRLDAENLAFAREKAKRAYGTDIDRDLTKAIDALRKRSGRLEQCMKVLQMTMPISVLWQNIRRLAPRKTAPKRRSRG